MNFVHDREKQVVISTLVFSYDEQERFGSQLWYFPVKEMPFVALRRFLRLLHNDIDPEKVLQ